MNYSAGMVSQVFAFVETKQTAELMLCKIKLES